MAGEHGAGQRGAGEHGAAEYGAAAEHRFGDLVDELVGSPGVTPPSGGSGFGRSALRWEKKIFAMFIRRRLVVKLPAPRVGALVAGGDGCGSTPTKAQPRIF